MRKRKAGDEPHVFLHDADKRQVAQQLAEKYSKEIDEVCSETHMPQWSRDVISNKVIMDPILLPCGHRFDRENLCYNVLRAKPFVWKCPVHSCKQHVDLETIRKSSNLALKRDIQREEERRQVCYDAKYKELLLKMQEDIKQELDAAVDKRRRCAR
jgi:predicted Holliday junction resolvase-like endonuclease